MYSNLKKWGARALLLLVAGMGVAVFLMWLRLVMGD
jgi:hypothetical protein